MESINNIILKIDEELLLFINNLHSPFGDFIMYQFSDKLFWIPFYIFLLWLLIKKLGPKNSILCIIILSLMVFVTDQLGSHVIRTQICRLRPSSPLNPLSHLINFVGDYRGGDFGFPSCHAANTFALCIFVSNILKSSSIRCCLLIWAIIVSYSRLYLGVHYPTDILAGAILGICMGYNFYLIFNALLNLKIHRFLNRYKI